MTEEPKDIFEDFDPNLFAAPPTPEAEKKFLGDKPVIDINDLDPLEGAGLCPYYPKPCHKAETSQCTRECERNPESYMDPKIKEVFDKEPWSNYCFTCGEFIPSRNHEGALDPVEAPYSHIVATGYAQYKLKLSEWVMKRLTGKNLH